MPAELIIKTPVFKMIFPSIFTPYKVPVELSSLGPRYGCTALFDKAAPLDQMEDAMNLAAEGRFSKKDVTHYVRFPLRPGKKMSENLDLTTYRMLTMKSVHKPYVKDATQEIENGRMFTGVEESFYTGCMCTAEIMFYCYDSYGRKGVGAALLALTKVADVELTAEEAAMFSLDKGIPEIAL